MSLVAAESTSMAVLARAICLEVITLLEREAEAPVRPLARPSPAPAARTGTAAPAVRTVRTPPGQSG